MNRIHVAAAAVRTTPLAVQSNLAVVREVIAAARARGVSMLCLPELVLTGYGCEDAFHAPFVARHALDALTALLPDTRGMVVSVGLPLVHLRSLFNVAALIVDGAIVGIAAKKHLAGDGIHYEPRWFKPWPEGLVVDFPVGDARVPLGDLLFDVGGVRIGFEICEDAWVAGRPGAALAHAAVDVVLNPSASHFAFGKGRVREQLVSEGSRAFVSGYVYSNLLGNEAGRVIYDGDTLVAEAGRVIARGPRLSFARFVITEGVLDIARARNQAMRFSSYGPSAEEPHGLVRVAFVWSDAVPARSALVDATPESGPDPGAGAGAAMPKEDELARAIAIGLFDYLAKSRMQGFVVSLSGGVDSTAVVVLVWLAIHLSVRELGIDAVRVRLAHVRGIDACLDEPALVGKLLTTLYQRTASSGDATRDAARTVAARVGAKHLDLDVGDLVAGYVRLAEAGQGRPLAWDTDDLALQNVQARVRAPSAWLVANLEDKLLLTTSNRSEAALGYATMDGDTAGGLAPIAGIDKAYLRRWLLHVQEHGVAGAEPLRELACVNAMPSTPELRPKEAAQSSESDLMPFAVLDRIERAIVRDRRSPVDAVRLLVEADPTTPLETARRHVRRFCVLFARNQWKRERYAPSFHLDDENLDPKTWFRFPILSGGFDDELVALDEPDELDAPPDQAG